MVTVSGDQLKCAGTADICLEVSELDPVIVSALVVTEKPLGFCMIMGMDGVQALGGVLVQSPADVRFCGELEKCASSCEQFFSHSDAGGRSPKPFESDQCMQSDEKADTKDDSRDKLEVEKEDFVARFDESQRCWIINWKWSGDTAPDALKNSVSQYRVPADVRHQYEREIKSWIEKGWLQRYDEQEQGPPKGLIPMMAVVQQNKQKVRPVLDYREMNGHVETYTADMDACGEKLREWRKMGTDVALLDLRKAYLQIHVDERLWPFQTVVLNGVRYCLTRLGFGLNVAPSIMKTVLQTVVEQDPVVREAVSLYIDDVLVNENVISAEQVAAHLKNFGLECKPAVRLENGGRVLGLRVSAGEEGLQWRRDNPVETEYTLTKRGVFSLCGRLTGHHPVCGWLRPAASYLKRRVNELSDVWDEVITEKSISDMVTEVLEKVAADDPAKGRWDVQGDELTVWTDASSLALGVAIEVEGEIVEDGSWLRRDDGTHINVAELDAVLKGVNMAILWGAKKIRLMTDSQTVYHWIANTLSGKSRLKTKAASEMLIRRRLSTLQMLADEYKLDVTVHCVPSADNRADALTRVPQRWLHAGMESLHAGMESEVCAATGNADGLVDTHATEPLQAGFEEVRRIHSAAGHPGVRRTHFFAKRAMPSVTKSLSRRVVTHCQVCQSIDPAPIKWKKGGLSVQNVWQRLGIDITEYHGRPFLTIIDCGPSRFAIWRQLRLKTSAAVVAQLRSVFLERGAPAELLLDNDTAFRSRQFEAFAAEWHVELKFRCAYVPSGNGIAERVHRTVKTIAARTGCDIAAAVYLYNASPQDNKTDESTPANQLYRYNARAKLLESSDGERMGLPFVCSPRRGSFHVGDAVWVRPPGARCHTRYDEGVVTRRVSDQTVEVDGMPRHVRDLRHRSSDEPLFEPAAEEGDDGPLLVSLSAPSPHQDEDRAGEDEPPQLRRSERLRNKARESQV